MKINKKIIIGLISFIFFLVILPLIACTSTSDENSPADKDTNNKNIITTDKAEAPEYKEFNSFTGLENFADGVVAIEVQWDLLGAWGNFIIDDAEQVENIVEKCNNAKMKNIGTEEPVGGNGGMGFVYEDGSKISVGFHIIRDNKSDNYYAYPDSSIRDYVEQIGIAKGVIPE